MFQMTGSRSCAAAAAFASMLAVASPAQAAVYTGAWDPAFGSSFPDLGWRGEATFFVPDACLSRSGWVFNFDSCSSSGMRLVSAEVDFYKLSDPENTAFQETLSFDDPSPFVLSMKIENGLLTGVLGTFDYFRPSTLPLAGGPYTDFVLLFENDIARMGFVSDPPEGHKSSGFSDRSPPDGSPFITFRFVPEPGSLPLLLAGLGVIGFLARRRLIST
jgi:hypothetical protein